MSSVALAVEAMLKGHVHNTFDEAFEKTGTVAPSSSSRHSPLLKWRSRLKEKQRGIEKEKEKDRGKQWRRKAWHKRE